MKTLKAIMVLTMGGILVSGCARDHTVVKAPDKPFPVRANLVIEEFEVVGADRLEPELRPLVKNAAIQARLRLRYKAQRSALFSKEGPTVTVRSTLEAFPQVDGVGRRVMLARVEFVDASDTVIAKVEAEGNINSRFYEGRVHTCARRVGDAIWDFVYTHSEVRPKETPKGGRR